MASFLLSELTTTKSYLGALQTFQTARMTPYEASLQFPSNLRRNLEQPWINICNHMSTSASLRTTVDSRAPHKGRVRSREATADLLLLDWLNLWTAAFVTAEKRNEKQFEVAWRIPAVLRLFDMLHPGKLRLSQGRWIVSELESASSDGMSSCRASLVSVSSLRSSVCVCAAAESLTDTQTRAHTMGLDFSCALKSWVQFTLLICCCFLFVCFLKKKRILSRKGKVRKNRVKIGC